MADFSTHVFTAAAVSSFGATLSTKLLELSMAEGMALSVAGIVGGVLPDIDLKVSWPSRLLFSLLGVIAALSWLFANVQRLTVIELWLAAIGIFLLVRYPLQWLFHRMTVHRGALHSLAATVMFVLLLAAGTHHLLGVNALLSWLMAFFLGLGCLLHLMLDELYSVDFTGIGIKRSFGSALKLIDRDRKAGTAAVIIVGLVAFTLRPDTQVLVDAFADVGQRWQGTILPSWLFATRY